MRRFLRDNSLSTTLCGLFLVFLLLQSITGWRTSNQDNQEHRQPTQSYPRYLSSAHFVEATAENWESEFLQMASYVVLTALLVQRGSPESKDPDAKEEVDEDPREASGREDVPGPVRRGGLALAVYQHQAGGGAARQDGQLLTRDLAMRVRRRPSAHTQSLKQRPGLSRPGTGLQLRRRDAERYRKES
jgi:hypothetical protein